MAENFDLIFGQNASQQYAWSDNDYQNGWETIGNIPPTAAQFDALQRRSDTKMKELNDELTPLVNANTTDNRQPATEYSEGTIKYTPLLPTGWFLECTVAGVTDTGEIVLPTPPAEKDTVADGTVTWTIRKMGSGSGGDGFAIGDIKAIAYNGTVQQGWLLCDGSAVSRTMFPDLFAAIGTTYGAGDGSTTFNVPDYNSAERFVQGSSTAGTVKQAGLPNITGRLNDMYQNGGSSVDSWNGAVHAVTSSSGSQATGATTYKFNYFDIDASRSNPIYGNSDTVQPPALTARYIIKAYDGVTPTPAEADISQMLTELTGKANRQLSNLDTANLACHVVVDSYYDATTGDWWREYDDGWLEQGGVNVGAGSGSKTITFLKPFADTNYYINNVGTTAGGAWDNTGAAPYAWALSYCGGVDALTTTSFVLTNRGRNVWCACGMGAQS